MDMFSVHFDVKYEALIRFPFYLDIHVKSTMCTRINSCDMYMNVHTTQYMSKCELTCLAS